MDELKILKNKKWENAFDNNNNWLGEPGHDFSESSDAKRDMLCVAMQEAVHTVDL